VGKRLPTEKEWEYAARGTDKRLYPWGNAFDAARANVADSEKNGPVAVGSYPAGKSPFAALDMAGNVAEWTDSDSFRYPGSQATPKPGKIVRGGSFRASKIYAMTTTRTAVLGDRALPDVGFRCAKSAPSP
jgi:formylglycine-generating enzyme required for sulfatase activity